MNQYTQIKYAIGEAFKALRRSGFIARQSYLCCRSCAGAALDVPQNKGKPAVYYTRQDRDDFERSGQVYLGYGYVAESDDEGTAAVGQRIVQALADQGLETEWDGNPINRILVKGFLPPEPEATFLDLVEVN